jgi:hypothetical protein
MLLWASEEHGIPSGTVLPVYIKSNIEKVWVAGIPAEYRKPGEKNAKIEIPLSKLEIAGSKRAARRRAEEFSEYALVYAETLQDGLPIRDAPDNGARRVYRLRSGEIIKILNQVDGVPAISANGEPLAGDWFSVLAEDGTTGYCFSYRLKFFEHINGPLNSAVIRTAEETSDTELENVLSKKWVAGIYGDMIDNGNIDIEAFSKHWGFSPGEESGVAHISLPDADISFRYDTIRSEGGNSWLFEGAPLSMKLRSPAALVVQYEAEGAQGASNSARGTELFINMPYSLDDIIAREKLRRESLFNALYIEGPAFSSASYGRLRLNEGQDFLWEDFERLTPGVIPASALGRGKIEMGLFLPANLESQYSGALTFKFKSTNGQDVPASFLYTIENGSNQGGVRLEYIPPSNIDGNRVLRRAYSPMIIYFYHAG